MNYCFTFLPAEYSDVKNRRVYKENLLLKMKKKRNKSKEQNKEDDKQQYNIQFK